MLVPTPAGVLYPADGVLLSRVLTADTKQFITEIGNRYTLLQDVAQQ